MASRIPLIMVNVINPKKDMPGPRGPQTTGVCSTLTAKICSTILKDGLLLLIKCVSEMSIATQRKVASITPGVKPNKWRNFLCVLSGTFLLWRSMGDYIFLNRSNMSFAMDLPAWHIEATPLQDNVKSSDQVAKSQLTEIQNCRTKEISHQRVSYGQTSRPLSCILHPGPLEVVLC